MIPALFQVVFALVDHGARWPSSSSGRSDVIAVTPEALFAVVWLGVSAPALAYLAYFRLLQHWGATRTSMVAYLLPVFGIALGALVLDEPIDAGPGRSGRSWSSAASRSSTRATARGGSSVPRSRGRWRRGGADRLAPRRGRAPGGPNGGAGLTDSPRAAAAHRVGRTAGRGTWQRAPANRARFRQIPGQCKNGTSFRGKRPPSSTTDDSDRRRRSDSRSAVGRHVAGPVPNVHGAGIWRGAPCRADRSRCTRAGCAAWGRDTAARRAASGPRGPSRRRRLNPPARAAARRPARAGGDQPTHPSRRPLASRSRKAPQPDASTIADSRSGATAVSGAIENATRMRR